VLFRPLNTDPGSGIIFPRIPDLKSWINKARTESGRVIAGAMKKVKNNNKIKIGRFCRNHL